ncbi:MAG TPA: LuxR C-terminal-related transcriptional regulator [Actinomycetospora sp.]|jgi:DNA-binding CsgD family transcriptional regulator|uniref:helix-turn-helix transcriptional regulator n=1 Tax=Actinomycetospora sp. TaxID=1872135 RepID=UPI002F4291A5
MASNAARQLVGLDGSGAPTEVRSAYAATDDDESADALEAALVVIEQARNLLGWAPGDDEVPVVGHAGGARALARAWDEAGAEIGALAVSGADPRRLQALVGLLSDIRDAEQQLETSASAATGGLISRVRDGLQTLRRAGSLTEMIDQAPIVAAGIGFDRVLLSRVDESAWVPERMYVKGDGRWAEEILEAGRQQYRLLDSSLLETRMVRRATPLRVTDPLNRPLMHQELVTSSRTRGYVAAPISDNGTVIGFLHADCYGQRRMPAHLELEALWVFSQSLGTLLARQSIADRLESVRREADHAPSSLLVACSRRDEGAPDRSRRPEGHAGWSLRESSGAAGARSARHHALLDVVTRREIEVLQLMADGASNEQIARRLVISVGTVKSHVKRILRKLDASNRAEAVSCWLRSEYGRTSAGASGPT